MAKERGGLWNEDEVYSWNDRDDRGVVTHKTTILTLKGADPKKVEKIKAKVKEDAVRARYNAPKRMSGTHPAVRAEQARKKEGRKKKNKKEDD